MSSFGYAIILFIVMASLFFLSYYFNAKTPKPDGCENLNSECKGCKMTSCPNHPIHDIDKGENKDA